MVLILIPISARVAYRRLRHCGYDDSDAADYDATLAQGQLWQHPDMQAVLGADVANTNRHESGRYIRWLTRLGKKAMRMATPPIHCEWRDDALRGR